MPLASDSNLILIYRTFLELFFLVSELADWLDLAVLKSKLINYCHESIDCWTHLKVPRYQLDFETRFSCQIMEYFDLIMKFMVSKE